MPVAPTPVRGTGRWAVLWARCATIFRLGIKELWSLWRDPAMLFLIVYTTTLAVYSAGMAQPETLYHVPIAIVDKDVSTLSQRIATAFFAPQFVGPDLIAPPQRASAYARRNLPDAAGSSSRRRRSGGALRASWRGRESRLKATLAGM